MDPGILLGYLSTRVSHLSDISFIFNLGGSFLSYFTLDSHIGFNHLGHLSLDLDTVQIHRKSHTTNPKAPPGIRTPQIPRDRLFFFLLVVFFPFFSGGTLDRDRIVSCLFFRIALRGSLTVALFLFASSTYRRNTNGLWAISIAPRNHSSLALYNYRGALLGSSR